MVPAQEEGKVVAAAAAAQHQQYADSGERLGVELGVDVVMEKEDQEAGGWQNMEANKR